jgi:hypothetical protein
VIQLNAQTLQRNARGKLIVSRGSSIERPIENENVSLAQAPTAADLIEQPYR